MPLSNTEDPAVISPLNVSKVSDPEKPALVISEAEARDDPINVYSKPNFTSVNKDFEILL
jgi:hypothetical protein